VQAKRVPISLVALDRKAREPLSWLKGRSVGLLVGIAQPGTLRRTLQALGAEIVEERRFPDHHVFEASDLEGLNPAVSTWITTEKDALKILPEWVGSAAFWVLRIEAAFQCAEDRDDLAAHDVDGDLAAAIEAQLQDMGRLPER
jgi:tetraacyldisaccharide 4'-kinase